MLTDNRATFESALGRIAWGLQVATEGGITAASNAPPEEARSHGHCQHRAD